MAPPSVDFTIRIWLRLSSPETALLKFWKTTYRSPLGAVKGCGNWLASHVPAGAPLKLTGHSSGEVPLMAGTRFQVGPVVVGPGEADRVGGEVGVVLGPGDVDAVAEAAVPRGVDGHVRL